MSPDSRLRYLLDCRLKIAPEAERAFVREYALQSSLYSHFFFLLLQMSSDVFRQSMNRGSVFCGCYFFFKFRLFVLTKRDRIDNVRRECELCVRAYMRRPRLVKFNLTFLRVR